MRSIFRVAATLLALVSSAQAQNFGVVPPGQVIGNSSAASGPATRSSLSALFDRAFCSTANSAIARISGSWTCLASANNSVWATNGSGVPALTTTLPNAVQDNITRLGTITSGAVPLANVTGAGTMAAQNANNVAITGGSVTGLPSPSVAADAATKSYVDSVATGLSVKLAVKWGTAAVLPNTPTYANGAAGVGATLTAGANAAIAVDGNSPALNDRVLVKNQASGLENGVYTVTTVGSGAAAWVLTRATDFDTSAEMVAGSAFFVQSGTVTGGSTYVLSNSVTTVGTTAAVFSQFTSAGTSQWTTNAPNIGFTGGSVGIGTTSPVIGDATYTGYLVVTGAAPFGTWLALKNTDVSFSMGGIWMQINATSAGWVFGTENSGKAIIHYGTGASETAAVTDAKDGTKGITIDTSGNVGLGTVSPATQFHTTGSVRHAGLTGASTAGCVKNDTSGNLSAGNPCFGNANTIVATDSAYGCVGDGATNNDACWIAIKATMAASKVQKDIYFPPGRYRFNGQMTYAPPLPYTAITVRGAGPDVTEFYFPNAAGGLAFSYVAQTNYFGAVWGSTTGGVGITLQGFSVVTNQFASSGTAIAFASDAGPGNPVMQVNINNVVSRGADNNTGWEVGIDFNSINQSVVIGYENIGASGGSGIVYRGTSSRHAVDHHVMGSRIFGTDYGIDIRDWVEGVHITTTSLVGVETAVGVNLSASGPPLFIGLTNSDIGCGGSNCINLDSTYSAVITGNLILSGATAGNCSLLIKNSSSSIVNGNSFYGGGQGNGGTGLCLTNTGSVAAPYSTRPSQYYGNSFVSYAICVSVAAGVSRQDIGINSWGDCGTNYVNSGTNGVTTSYSRMVLNGAADDGSSGLQVRANNTTTDPVLVGYNSINAITSVIRANGQFESSAGIYGAGFAITGGPAGLTTTKTVRASGGGSDCTLVFTGGLYTGGTC